MGAAITEFFQGLVSDALNPLLGLLSDTLLTTPDPGSVPGLSELWNGSWQILLATYGLLVLLAGIVVMAHETLQSRTTIKETLPRLLVGFLAGAASFGIASQAIAVTNALTHTLLGDGLDPTTTGAALRDLILSSINHNYFLIFVAVLLVGMIVAVLIGFVIRVAVTIILIAAAPIALMFHALAETEGIAWWWWRAFGACLAIQVGQSLALVTALRVFLAPGGFTPFGPTQSGAVGLLVALALAWVIYRVPFWVLAVVRRGGGRRSLVGSLIRSYLVYRTFGLLTGRRPGRGGAGPRTGAGAGPGGPGTGGGGPGWGPGWGPRPRPGGPRGTGGGSRGSGQTGRRGGPGDPYARAQATGQGQYVLPLPGVRRTPPPRSAPAGASTVAGRAGAGAARGRQLVLPLGGEWPEQRPVLGRDGQYRLPIPVTRVPRPAPTSTTSTPAGARGRRVSGTQLQLPVDPYRGIRPTTAGQYPLPLDVQRTPRPAPTPPPTSTAPPTAAAGARVVPGRQLRLPLDLPRRPRPPRLKPPPEDSPSSPPPPSPPPTRPPSTSPSRPSRPRRRSSS